MKINLLLLKKKQKKKTVVFLNKFQIELIQPGVKKRLFLPFFSLNKVENIKNTFFIYNKSLLNSIFIKLKQGYAGLVNGFFIELVALGVGYRFERIEKNSNLLVINIGYSHYIYYLLKKNVAFRCTKGYLFLFSSDLKDLKQTAIEIKNYRLPDCYKGKGIRYFKQEIPLKIGKKKK